MQAFELSIRRPRPARCRVRVGVGALDRLVEELLRERPGEPLVLVSDSNVAPLHAAPLRARLSAAGLQAELLSFPAGESNKTRRTKEQLEDRLLGLGLDRDGALVAVGGGVTGDLAGFVAATWQRGVPVVQVPTTLLAMADAALGGKTAVNLPRAKNLIGAFHQPWGVYADVSTLSTLPDEPYADGFAEVVKSAAIADAAFFERLEGWVKPLLRRSATELEAAVARCMEIKSGIVQRDERDSGRRAVLNFGHTIAHALEAATGYALSHGSAVSIGLCVEARLATERSGFPRGEAERLASLLGAFGLPTQVPAGVPVDALIEATRRDKKARAGRARYVLPSRLGRVGGGSSPAVEVEESRVREALLQSGPATRN